MPLSSMEAEALDGPSAETLRKPTIHGWNLQETWYSPAERVPAETVKVFPGFSWSGNVPSPPRRIGGTEGEESKTPSAYGGRRDVPGAMGPGTGTENEEAVWASPPRFEKTTDPPSPTCVVMARNPNELLPANFTFGLRATKSRIVTEPGDADAINGRTNARAIVNTNPTAYRGNRPIPSPPRPISRMEERYKAFVQQILTGPGAVRRFSNVGRSISDGIAAREETSLAVAASRDRSVRFD